MSDKFYVTDTVLSERFPIYTRANVGEVFPDPVTPLTSSSALWEAELGWRDAWVRMGAFDVDELPADEFCQLAPPTWRRFRSEPLVQLRLQSDAPT